MNNIHFDKQFLEDLKQEIICYSPPQKIKKNATLKEIPEFCVWSSLEIKKIGENKDGEALYEIEYEEIPPAFVFISRLLKDDLSVIPEILNYEKEEYYISKLKEILIGQIPNNSILKIKEKKHEK